MKIVSLIKRKGGTVLKNFKGSGIDYHFKPEVEGGPHVCDVTNKDHVKTFLRITEGFEPFLGDETDDDEVQAINNEIEDETEREEREAAVAGRQKWPDIMEIAANDNKEWNNKRLTQYATEVMGINAGSRTEIKEYAEKVYGIVLPNTIRQAGPLIRELILQIQAIRHTGDTEDDEPEDSPEQGEGSPDQE